MSRLNVYANDIKNLYGFETFENIPDNVKTKLSGDLLKVLMNELGGQDFTTYLASLKDSDIAPFSSIKTHLLGDSKKESEFIDDITVFEDSVASIAVNSVWNTIFTEYKTANNLSKSLVGKKVENSYTVNSVVSGLTEELKKFFSDLDDVGLSVVIKEDKGVNYIAEYEKVKDLYSKLGEAVVVEEVKQAADKIILHLDTLYKGLFGNNYVGIILPGGKLIYSSAQMQSKYAGFMEEKRTYLQGMADSWYGITGINKISVDLETAGFQKKYYVFEENGEKNEYDMFPYMHRRHLTMKQAEYNKRKEEIRQDIVNYLTKAKAEEGGYSQAVIELERQILSCILLIEGNQHTVQLRASLLNNVQELKTNISYNLNENIQGAENLNILSNSVDGRVKTIHNITVIYSMNKFEQEVLFAHKLYNGPNATSPNITKPILGIKLDGTLFRENLFGEKFTTILAGSRSGKGTLTQSLLAPLIASGQSIVYLDNKPDIASLFWDLEDKYRTMGKDVHFLAIDSLAQSSTFIKNEVSAAPRGRVLDENGTIINLNNIPANCPLSNNTLLLLRTFKTLQLLFLAGEIQAKNKIDGPKLTNYVFIDEITDLSKRLYSLYSEIGGMGAPKKGDEDGAAAYEWMKKVCSVINDVNNGFNTMETMVSDKHNFKFVLVGQVFNKTTKWPGDRRKVNITPGLDVGLYNKHFVYRSMGLCNKWLSGRMQVTEEDYVLKDATEYKMAEKTGVFLYHTSKPNGPDNLIGEQPPIKDGTLFRSYFALVRNDIGDNIETIKNALDEGTVDEYFNEYQDTGYTNKFLYNRNKFYGQGDLRNSINEMYDFENNRPIRGVGFGGLLEDIAELDNIDMYSDEMVEKLNAPYDRLMYVLQTAGVMEELGYTCLEDYLYDCSGDSFFSKEELDSRFWRGFNNGGRYVPAAKASDKIDYSSLDLDDDLISDISGIDETAQEQADAIDTEGKTLEEIEAVKQQIFEEAENLKLDAIKDNLLKAFATGFNAKKGEVGDKIAKLLKSLYTYKQSPDAFNSAKESAMDSKITFIAKFDDLLEPLKEYPECMEFATGKINDFVNGKYVPIVNLTYEDVLNKGKTSGGSGSGGTTPITPPITPMGGRTTPFGTDEGMGGGTATPRAKSPIEDGETRRPINSNGGQRVTSPVDTEGLTYDLNDADSLGNAKVSSKLADRVVKDILKQFGGINNIDEITLNANGCLIINGYTYTPQFGDNFVNSLGEVQKMELQQGKLTSVLNVGRVINGISLNIATLSIESPQIAYNDLFMNDLGIKKDYTSLFKSHPNLEDIYLPDEELHRHGNQQQGRSGLGLGAKLAGIFGMGRGNKDSGDYVPNPAPTYQAPPLIEKMWQSKPVRVLTGALGWTLGCKAVVFAATVFGPWGLLFGALAAAGAYKEIKNEANQTRSTYNNNNRANNGNGGNNNGGNGNNRNRSSNNGGNNRR